MADHVQRDRRTQPAFANIRADLKAHGGRWGALGFWALVVYRFGRWRYGVRPALLRKPLSAVYKGLFKLVQIVTGIELPCEVPIGRNFVIDHHGGIVISGYARFGDDCRIRNGVCVGLSHTDDPCAPVIGNGVDIGAGAKVLGRITVGDHVAIGANAVVLRDVPSHSIAVGVPAVVKSRLPAFEMQRARLESGGRSVNGTAPHSRATPRLQTTQSRTLRLARPAAAASTDGRHTASDPANQGTST
jgi:serine O-acetyltransferase